MVIICAWCGRRMGVKEPIEDTSITHGKCPECVRKDESDE